MGGGGVQSSVFLSIRCSPKRGTFAPPGSATEEAMDIKHGVCKYSLNILHGIARDPLSGRSLH